MLSQGISMGGRMTSGSAADTAASATSDMRSAGATDALVFMARPRLPGVMLHFG